MNYARKHASALAQFARWLREGSYAPGDYQITSWLFLRALGLIYFSAFVSFGVQAMGLIGSHGIVPLADFVNAANHQLGPERYWLMPMLFWLNSSDFFIQAVCWAGAGLSLLLVANILPRLNLLLLYVFYLSLVYGGQVFMSFQWDILLADMGFLGLLLSIAQKPGILLLRWLTFRFMFLSGVVKIASGDPSWRDFSALTYHFETQPLPTPLAWYADHFSAGALALMTLACLFIELVLPFLIFFPRRLRFAAAFGILLLQATIALTGNYNFFNLSVMALCLALFDDAAFISVASRQVTDFIRKNAPLKPPGKIATRTVGALAAFIILATSLQLVMALGAKLPVPLAALVEIAAPLRVVSTYGPFAVMTKQRNEIIIEGSDDGMHWEEYGFQYKPGDVMRRPPWNIPHQPRLDWQFWFAALEPPTRNPWFANFLQRLLEGQPEVTALLQTNPFFNHPPHYVRALFYDYRFSTPEEKTESGAWWDRRLIGTYYPSVSLK
jgi:hypothetical protein